MPSVINRAAARTGAHGTSPGEVNDWRTKGACRRPEYDPDWWVPGAIAGPTAGYARYVCGTCPLEVATQCHAWAQANMGLCTGAVYAGVYYTAKAKRPVRPSAIQPPARRPGTLVPTERSPRADYPAMHDAIVSLAAAGLTCTAIARRLDTGTDDGVRAYMRAQGIPISRRQPAPCGTPGGYRAHQRGKEPPCDICRAAHNTYQRGQRTSRRAAA